MTDERRAYQDKLQARIDEVQADIDKLGAKARQANAAARIEFDDQMQRLRLKSEQLGLQADKLQNASESAWRDVKDGAEDAWTDLKSALKQAQVKLH